MIVIVNIVNRKSKSLHKKEQQRTMSYQLPTENDRTVITLPRPLRSLWKNV